MQAVPDGLDKTQGIPAGCDRNPAIIIPKIAFDRCHPRIQYACFKVGYESSIWTSFLKCKVGTCQRGPCLIRASCQWIRGPLLSRKRNIKQPCSYAFNSLRMASGGFGSRSPGDSARRLMNLRGNLRLRTDFLPRICREAGARRREEDMPWMLSRVRTDIGLNPYPGVRS